MHRVRPFEPLIIGMEDSRTPFGSGAESFLVTFSGTVQLFMRVQFDIWCIVNAGAGAINWQVGTGGELTTLY